VLGETQLAAGERSAARRSFRRALELDAEDWRAWYELAVVSPPAVQRLALGRIAALNPRAVRRLPALSAVDR
jgi:predicted TPR repeat methyltransferase